MVDWARFEPSDFEYDDEADHLAQHGVNLEEAVQCFYNEHTVRQNRRRRSRWQILGRTDAGRLLKVIFELKPGNVVRIITGWQL